MENFDPIGRWRNTYGRNNPIDASGQVPNGQSFEDIEGFKAILVQQRDLFAKTLIQKVLAYAIGRRTHPSDRPAIDRIASDLRNRGGGFRDLIKQVVLSEPFRSK